MPDPFPRFDPDVFKALWERYGNSRTWTWYAEQLGVSELALQVWVSRHRAEIGIPVRQVSLRNHPELFPWPRMLAVHRNAAARRFLEDEAVVREHGAAALAESRRPRWERWRRRLVERGEVVTYTVEDGFGTRRATPEELEVNEDGDRRRFAELLE